MPRRCAGGIRARRRSGRTSPAESPRAGPSTADMKRHRQASSSSPTCRRNPANVSQRYGWMVCGTARRQNRCTSAPASSAVAALSNADAPAPSTATRRPRSAAKSIGSAACARKRAGSAATKPGIHHWPAPSCPVASTIFRACRTFPSARVAARRSPSGAMSTTSAPLRTGTPVTRRIHSRYRAQCSRGIMPSASQSSSPNIASCQLR